MSGFKRVTFVFSILLIAVVFTMGLVRGKCINKGYELSNMAYTIEERRISMEKIEENRMALINKEYLFQVASEREFVMMNEGKTFNVQ